MAHETLPMIEANYRFGDHILTVRIGTDLMGPFPMGQVSILLDGGEYAAWDLHRSAGYYHAITIHLDGHRMLVRTFVDAIVLGRLDSRIEAFLDGARAPPFDG